MKNHKYILYNILFAIVLMGCEEFLDEKPRMDLVVPESIEDLQGLLDASTMGMNDGPGLTQIGSDDLWTTDAGWVGFIFTAEQNAYLWKENIYDDPFSAEWTMSYRQIFYSNVVLKEVQKFLDVPENKKSDLDNVIGSAHFYRANAFHDLLTVFSNAYDPNTSATDLGVPLRLSPNVEERLERASLEASYAQVIQDLKTAISYLPDRPLFPSRPSRASCYALLARVYLNMGNYEEAGDAAKSALAIKQDLMDYNNLDPNIFYPFAQFNPEVIFHSKMITYMYQFSNQVYVNNELIASYDQDDLRTHLYFTPRGDGRYNFRGHYTGNFSLFCGLATDELYYIISETAVRLGNLEEAATYMNHLLSTRYVSGTLEPITFSNQEEALQKVLLERRKGLLFRGIRWQDMKRLNLDLQQAINMEREIGGEVYTLSANSPRYVFPLPDEEINLGGLKQNPR
ncbi:RagB/SusD family nutrient uptake outer membrane protein [Litoribacter populi]|uniref:RagB/SusD family nutrient uptake outer membrane protein n=1 Tax=Litoribacter populi TaxID=2598460 RepID=UPI00117F7B1A|nr:RagB/SusD family nutrient uptake outer membrane protein [Litoribacter populi]